MREIDPDPMVYVEKILACEMRVQAIDPDYPGLFNVQDSVALAGQGHPIIPVMLGDAKVAGEMAQRLLAEGLYVTAFSYPVVPQGKARIRTQMSAAHSDDDIDLAVAAFTRVGRDMGVI